MATNPQDRTIAQITLAPFRLIIQVSLSIALLWFLSIGVLITWIDARGLDTKQHIGRLIDFYVQTPNALGKESLIEKMASGTYWLAFEATPLQRRLLKEQPPDGNPTEMRVGKKVKQSFWAAFSRELEVAAYGTVLFGVRLAILLLMLPLFAVLLACASIDGMVQRYIRKACAGHESASLYHRAKFFGIRFIPPFCAVLFLASPVAYEPAWLFVPVMLTSALLVRVQATYYKKYL